MDLRGQSNLIEQFNTFTINTLPHSIILIGKFGCGKHLFCTLLAKQFGLTLRIQTEKINYDTIEELNNLTDLTLCVINSKDITQKEESVLLKFIEEPKQNIFTVIISESTVNILDTILNRCHVYYFSEYTKEDLKSICNIGDSNIFTILDTPGKINLWANSVNLIDLFNYCTKIFDKISITLLSNILNICNKIDFDNTDTNKYNIDLFVSAMLYCAKERVKNNLPYATQQYILTNKLANNLLLPNINKQQLFEHYLTELKGI